METARTLHRHLTTDSPTTSLPIPSLSWLTTLIPTNTSRTTPPLPSLLATARLRLLSSDLSTPGLLDAQWVAGHSFPACLTAPGAEARGRGGEVVEGARGREGREGREVAETRELREVVETRELREVVLDRDVVVQVLDVENLNRSKWEVVEELEAIERGEQTRGREVIRLPTSNTGSGADGSDDGSGLDLGDSGGGTQTQAFAQNTTVTQAVAQAKERERKNATHKLTIQDSLGHRLYALELRRIDEIGVPQFGLNGKMIGGGGTPIGCKLLLRRGTKVARGVVLLEPGMVKVLGGRVEGWGRVWERGRLERLKGEVQRE